MPEPVVIVDYDPEWPERFERERERVAAALGDAVARIEHVGSTSVPGLAAKPIVDMDVVLRDLDAWEGCVEALAALGHERFPRGDMPGRRAFSAPGTHLNLTEEGSSFLAQHLRLRDRLRADLDAAARYADLKRRLAAAHGADRDGYTFAKTAFVLETLSPENRPVLAFLQGGDGSHEDLGFRLRRAARAAGLDAVDQYVDRAACLTTGEGRVVAFGLGFDALYLPLEPADVRGLTAPHDPAPPLEGWTAVDAYQPELPAGEGLRRLAIALRRAWGRTTRE